MLKLAYKYKEEIVSVDFMEIDNIRAAVRAMVKERGAYDYSRWYIGRGVTRLSFFSIYVSVFQMRRLVNRLKESFPYDMFVYNRDLHIYMRGKRK